MRHYSTATTAEALGLAERTLRRWCSAGEVPGAKRSGPRGSWRIPADALDALRDRMARDVEPIPVIEPIAGDQARAEYNDATDNDAPAGELAPVGQIGQAVALLELVQGMADQAAERERDKAATVAETLQQTVADQARALATQEQQIGTLQELVTSAHAMLRDERSAHAATRRELDQLRLQRGLPTRPTGPLRVIGGNA